MSGALSQPTGDRVTLFDFKVLGQFPNVLARVICVTEYAANQMYASFLFLVIHMPYLFYTIEVLLSSIVLAVSL